MNKGEIVKVISEDKTMPFIQPDQLASIVDFVIKNYKPSLPSNLDEAANRQAALEQPYKWEEEQDGSFGVTPLFVMSNIRSTFKAGAEWIAGQGVRAHCVESANPVSESSDVKLHTITLLYEENERTPYVQSGDNIDIIIRKD